MAHRSRACQACSEGLHIDLRVKASPLHVITIRRSHGRGEERTCYPRNAPPVLGGEHVLQDSRHHGELHDAAQGGDHERGAETEVKRLRDHRAERDKGEADADVCPFEGRHWGIW